MARHGWLLCICGLAVALAGCSGQLYEDPQINVTVQNVDAYAGSCEAPEPLENATTVCATWNLTVHSQDERELPLDGTLYYGQPWILFDAEGNRYDAREEIDVDRTRSGSDLDLEPGSQGQLFLRTQTPYQANLTHLGYEAQGTKHPVNTSVPDFEVDEIELNVSGEVIAHRVEEEDCTWYTQRHACHRLTVRLTNGNERFTIPSGALDEGTDLSREDKTGYSPSVPPGETREFEMELDRPEGKHLRSLTLNARWMYEPLNIPVPELEVPDHPARVYVNYEPAGIPAPDCFLQHPTECPEWTVQVWNQNLSQPAQLTHDNWMLVRDQGTTFPVESVEGPPSVPPGEMVNVTIVFGETEPKKGVFIHGAHLLYDSEQVREPVTVKKTLP